jgi:hypothetical protein
MSVPRASRLRRVSPERVYELARHLTERDRELAATLYQQRILTTDQLQLLFFTSRRRAQDRLLYLYRHQVVDRFYPPLRFGHGKATAHWLLDEAGALLVAARLGVERKQLRWRRRDDWGSHPQLAHQLDTNRFVTDLIAATTETDDLGVSVWWSSAGAAGRVNDKQMRGSLIPDTGFLLGTPAGPVECLVEWDRGTETTARLAEKLVLYRTAESRLRYGSREPCSVLFVVPSQGRVETLHRAFRAFAEQRDQRTGAYQVSLHGDWPLVAATVPDLRSFGPLGRIWWPLDPDSRDGPFTLAELPVSRGWAPTAFSRTLGRRWRTTTPGFWERLSPLAAGASAAASEAASRRASIDLPRAGIDGSMDDPGPHDDEDKEVAVSW